MCVKFPFGNLNISLGPQHLTSIYTCGVTTASRHKSPYYILAKALRRGPIALLY